MFFNWSEVKMKSGKFLVEYLRQGSIWKIANARITKFAAANIDWCPSQRAVCKFSPPYANFSESNWHILGMMQKLCKLCKYANYVQLCTIRTCCLIEQYAGYTQHMLLYLRAIYAIFENLPISCIFCNFCEWCTLVCKWCAKLASVVQSGERCAAKNDKNLLCFSAANFSFNRLPCNTTLQELQN